MVRANCDVVIKLSGVLQRFLGRRDRVENVNGVRRGFGDGGGKVKDERDRKPYFLGKVRGNLDYQSRVRLRRWSCERCRPLIG